MSSIEDKTQNIRAPALSPLDGRYSQHLQPLALLFSEESLILRRVQVEMHWLLHLSKQPHAALAPLAAKSAELAGFSSTIDSIISNKEKSLSDLSKIASEVKEEEQNTRHDVKAVEYWLQRQFRQRDLQDCIPFIHFACTSEDINSLSWALMLAAALDEQLLPQLRQLGEQIGQMATASADLPMLARTHGQAASPTTLGKEIAVFAHRLRAQAAQLAELQPRAKFSGATGNYSAHSAALPDLDWPALCRDFVQSMRVAYNGCTTQVESGDRLAEICHCLMRVNRILTDLARDFWGYVSLGFLAQKKVPGEIGSSTMPHKINPIDFENAEGNMAVAHALLERLAADLPVSRWQRDLSGSTLQRNLGSACGHCTLAWLSLARGLHRVSPDPAALADDLRLHWEVLVEAVQTALRLTGDASGYEKMQQLTQRGDLDAERFATLIAELPGLDAASRERLQQLSPEGYIGLASEIARRFAL